MVYLDYASTTPTHKEVVDAMLPYFTTNFGNAASTTHIYGDVARNAVLKAKSDIAQLIGGDKDEIYFTSGATESINLALKGVYFNNLENGNHIITVKTEHKAVLDTCSYLESIGADITYLDVDINGIIDIEALKSEIKATTILVCVMHTNNETGVIQDINGIGLVCSESGVTFMSDGTQAFGKILIDVVEQNIDILCFSGHKIYGPKGIGGIYIKQFLKLQLQMHGGGHQRGMRSGTLNVPGIVGLGKASEIAMMSMKMEYARINKIRNAFEKELVRGGRIIVNSFQATRSPYITNFQLLSQEAEDFILRNRENLAITTGSACNSEVFEPSYVLMAMGLSNSEAIKSIRVSFGSRTTFSDLEFLTSII